MAHTYTNLLSHVIFSTKDRMPVLDPELKGRLFPYMGGIIRELGGHALIINGPADHVHLLLLLPPTLAMSDVLRACENEFVALGSSDAVQPPRLCMANRLRRFQCKPIQQGRSARVYCQSGGTPSS